MPLEMLLLLATPLAGGIALALSGHRRYAAELNAAHGTKWAAENLLVSVGAKHSLFNICMALLSPGDEAIVPTPCWVSYPDQCQLAGATPVLVETTPEEGFKLTPARLRRALTQHTQALFLCTPNNPTGAAYSRAELGAVMSARVHAKSAHKGSDPS